VICGWLVGFFLFWLDLVVDFDFDCEEIYSAFWDLVWVGEVINDVFVPLCVWCLIVVVS